MCAAAPSRRALCCLVFWFFFLRFHKKQNWTGKIGSRDRSYENIIDEKYQRTHGIQKRVALFQIVSLFFSCRICFYAESIHGKAFFHSISAIFLILHVFITTEMCAWDKDRREKLELFSFFPRWKLIETKWRAISRLPKRIIFGANFHVRRSVIFFFQLVSNHRISIAMLSTCIHHFYFACFFFQ